MIKSYFYDEEKKRMPLDAVALRAVVYELNEIVSGGRIDKIMQPESSDIVLGIRAQNKNVRLLLSARADGARLHLTETNRPNPDRPPMLCMLLRKHILGGKIIRISQLGMERIVSIHIEASDELGDLKTYRLIIEIMGRHSNIMLVNDKDIIIDSVKHVTAAISRVRQVLPGLAYAYPPAQSGKADPFDCDFDALMKEADDSADKFISAHILGLSLASAKRIVALAEAEGLTLAAALGKYYALVRDCAFEPVMLLNEDGENLDYFPFAYLGKGLAVKRYEGMNACLDDYFSSKQSFQLINEKAVNLRRTIAAHLDKALRKKELYESVIAESADYEHERLIGELITANIYTIKKGDTTAELLNYYDGTRVSAELDEKLTPAQNAQRYYKRYNKKKNASEMAAKQLSEIKKEIEYLEQQKYNAENCAEPAELAEITDELASLGYIRDKRKKAGGPTGSKPMHYKSDDGFDIWVGKNSRQNERLTFSASPNDLWLHVKDMAGAHVIVRNIRGQVSDNALYTASLLAAYHSSARNGVKVAVDYTERRHVDKIKGAQPGLVTYTDQRTVFVTPDKAVISKIRLSD